MRTGVSIPLSRGGELKGVLALPAADTPQPLPGVIVLHEIFGEQPEILEVADRFAARGYGALAPDLFSSGIRLGLPDPGAGGVLAAAGRAASPVRSRTPARGWPPARRSTPSAWP